MASLATPSEKYLFICLLDKGSYFGEDGIFNNREYQQRTNSVMTTCECVLVRINGEFFYNNFKALVEGGRMSRELIK